MELHIAGGTGEHGRNCFAINAPRFSIILDCGIGNGIVDTFPDITIEEARRSIALFISHSHLDHTGAIDKLLELGFNGDIIATESTLKQLSLRGKNTIALEELKGQYKGISIKWGRSGHCMGSVWYSLGIDGKRILYTGDYIENTAVYNTDPIRGQKADIAIIDTAYGNEGLEYKEYISRFVNGVREEIEKHNTIVFPIPKFGRGLEIEAILSSYGIKARMIKDDTLKAQEKEAQGNPFWCKSFQEINDGQNTFYFLSDPQLRKEENRVKVMDIISNGGGAIMTGNADPGSFSKELINSGKMRFLRFPVHMNKRGEEQLVKSNDFSRVLSFHSPDFDYPRIIEF